MAATIIMEYRVSRGAHKREGCGGGRVKRARAGRVWTLAAVLVFALAAHAPGIAGQTASTRGGRGNVAAQAAKTGAKSRRTAAENAYAAALRLSEKWGAESARASALKYEEAAGHWRAAGDRLGEANALDGLGDALQLAGRTQESLRAYERALALGREAGEQRVEAEVLKSLCYLHNSLGDNARAFDECSRALELARASGTGRVEAEALNGLGEVYYGRDDVERALAFYTEALTLWRGLGDGRGQAQTLTYLGYAHAVLKEIPKAFDFYTQALALWRAAADQRGEIQTLTAMGYLNSNIGETQESLNLYYRAMLVASSVPCPDLEAPLLSGIGYAYNELGERRKSLLYYERALAIYKSLGDSWGEAAVQLTLGMVYRALGEHERALSNYRQTLATYRAQGKSRSVSHVLREIGLVHDARANYAEALKHYRASLELTPSEKDPREAAYTLGYIGRIHERAGERAHALDYYGQALALSRASGDRFGEGLALYSRARARHGRGDYAAARTDIEAALKISETLRAKVASDDLKASYFASVQDQFELYTGVLMRLHEQQPAAGFDAAAFEASERARARSLVETLAGARADIRQGVDEALLRSERALSARINAKVGRRVHLLASKSQPDALAAVEKELAALTAEYQQVQGQIRASSPRYAALVQPSPLTLAEIQKRVLDEDTVLLEYSLGDERSFVWVVTPRTLKAFPLPGRSRIEGAARRLYELLTEHNRVVKGETGAARRVRLDAAEAAYPEAAAALARLVLEPVAREIGAQQRIVVVSDGALQYVPFAALPDPTAAAAAGDEQRPPLIVGHEVLSLPSASVLAVMRDELRGRTPAPQAVAVLADPVFDRGDERLKASALAARTTTREGRIETAARRASEQGQDSLGVRALRSFDEGGTEGFARLPFSRREARAIMEVVPDGEGLLALGFRASRATAVSGELARYRIIHIASHGLLNSEHPELSGIVLSLYDEAGRPQEGFLELNEIYNLQLPADLVVLSACQTALGKEVRGEGLVGLTRGFMYAGAARVVASLWKVDDAATAELMGEFYRAMLGKRQSAAAALRSAQVQMWRDRRWRAPYYWAAFNLQGEWR